MACLKALLQPRKNTGHHCKPIFVTHCIKFLLLKGDTGTRKYPMKGDGDDRARPMLNSVATRSLHSNRPVATAYRQLKTQCWKNGATPARRGSRLRRLRWQAQRGPHVHQHLSQHYAVHSPKWLFAQWGQKRMLPVVSFIGYKETHRIHFICFSFKKICVVHSLYTYVWDFIGTKGDARPKNRFFFQFGGQKLILFFCSDFGVKNRLPQQKIDFRFFQKFQFFFPEIFSIFSTFGQKNRFSRLL